jgi:Protein of unknown function (DUF1593)
MGNLKRIFLLFVSMHLSFAQKQRVLVLSDIEADPDNVQSLVRLLTYSNQWDIEGLIDTTSIHQKNWAGS